MHDELVEKVRDYLARDLVKYFPSHASEMLQGLEDRMREPSRSDQEIEMLSELRSKLKLAMDPTLSFPGATATGS
ncbi:hypothetical protein VQH23_20985 [Pararoseomonas sp. SCSIO 73927]|uniref:hypothetical protein n=1 Tax=Pararoseomonas sp. SCSIO 73927 TaxID=3114537 RepID=UPI0030D36495